MTRTHFSCETSISQRSADLLNCTLCFFLDIGAKNISFDFGKTAPRKRKAEMPAKEQGTDRKSTLSVR